jgi:sulfur carrier protein ThiS
MQITLLPQHKLVELNGRRRVAEILKVLNLIPGTVMVIRSDELLTDQDVIEADDKIEIRNVISGG